MLETSITSDDVIIEETTMSDQTKTPETKTTETAETTTPAPPEGLRDSPAFNAVTAQLKELADRNAELTKQIEDEAKAKADEAAAKERKELEAKGEYEAALEKLKTEHEAAAKAHQRELTVRDLRAEMLKAGCSNDLVIQGAVAGYVEGDVSEYVTKLKEANPSSFAEPGITPARGGPAQGGATGPGETDWSKIKDNLHTGSVAEARAANAAVAAYVQKNGALPPGFGD